MICQKHKEKLHKKKPLKCLCRGIKKKKINQFCWNYTDKYHWKGYLLVKAQVGNPLIQRL